MTMDEYRELMISVLKMQVEEIVESDEYENSRFLEGQEVGLRIAIRKLELSEFLTTDKGEKV